MKADLKADLAIFDDPVNEAATSTPEARDIWRYWAGATLFSGAMKAKCIIIRVRPIIDVEAEVSTQVDKQGL